MINPDGIILSISGQSLTKEEKSFFKETNPLGFVLFKRNFKDVIQLRDLIVVKSDGQKESFDRDKMYRSLSLALRKRDIETEKIEKIVNAIVRKLENSGEGEIKTELVGQYIMEALSILDQVAYVRFASVYKNFREVKDFEDFLGNLEDK